MLCVNKHKRLLNLIMLLFSFILIFLYFTPTTETFDETYTLELIHHSYTNIIYFDSMDVHPILYYFLIKLFINITTFWTSSIAIKILSARLFSFIIFVIVFVFLRKVLMVLSIKNNIFIEWILFLILPGVLNSSIMDNAQLTNIRMYSLATLFIIIEFFYLLRFSLQNKKSYLIIAVISAILASYTHYYAAMFSGLLILVYGIRYLLNHNKAYIEFFLSDIILVMSFMPWMFIFIKQIQNPNTYWMSNGMELKEIIKFLVISILFMYPIYKYKEMNHNTLFNIQISNLYLVLIPIFIFSLVYICIKGPIFETRYMFPVFVIYEFLSINIAFKYLYVFHIDRKILYGCIIIIVSLSCAKTCLHQVPEYITSFKISREFNPHKNEYLSINNSRNSVYISNAILNMSLSHKRIIVPNRCKSYFIKNSHIYSNSTYKSLFKNEISRIVYK